MRERVDTPLPPVKLLSDEWIILLYLKNWTGDDIRRAIRYNADLAVLLTENPRLADGFAWIVRRKAGEMGAWMQPGYVLEWFRQRRPDLHAAIISEPGGIFWLQRNFQNLRKTFGI